MGTPSEGVLARLKTARLLALDVDGTLTDGKVIHSSVGGGGELQTFHVHDGQGLVWLRRAEVEVAWITGRGCDATRARARELGVRELHLGAGPKDEVLREIQERLSIGTDETVSMGDDLPDLALAERSAVFCAPSNARAEVCAAADLVTTASGGAGAVRELAETILTAMGRWPGIADVRTG
jgi:3-deoxy-D-manno-octulosonate 8-phosphate phosphatase (KDO 8-P phosphatase)